MSDTHALEEAIADSELLYINFFNGRLLSAGDLTQEQTVNRARARHLGQAVGTGVAFGLEVSPAAGSPLPAGWVEVTAGLAVNAAGQTLRLACKQTIALVETPDSSQMAECLFADCELLPDGTTASAPGYYLLTIAPAAKKDGLAPVSGLGNQIAECNSKYYAEGVKFRFIRLQTSAGGAQARNTLAYQCFGRPGITAAGMLNAALVLATEPNYGVATLASGQLTDEDVPLAVIEWKSAAGLGFIDLWSVRRRIERPVAEGRWDYLVADRRRAEGEAMFLQFQEEVQSLPGSSSGLASVAATDYFGYLPALGILPVTGPGSPSGIDAGHFFGPHASNDVALLDAGEVRSLLKESLDHEPVSLDTVGKLQLYLVWETVRAVETGAANQLTMVFASPALPYRGTARFGYAKWGLSRFAEFVL